MSLLHVLSQLSQIPFPRTLYRAIPTAHRTSYFQLLDLSLSLLVGEDDDRTFVAQRTRFPVLADTLYTPETEVMATTAGQVRLPLYGTEADWAREAFWYSFDEVLLVKEKIISRKNSFRHLLPLKMKGVELDQLYARELIEEAQALGRSVRVAYRYRCAPDGSY